MNEACNLPGAVLQTQICDECLQYLSVPPVVINKLGKRICGRCFSPDLKPKSTKSYFNVIAQGIAFKCVNHFNGCNEILPFSQVADHEKTCRFDLQECFFCSFSGNVCQIVNHSVKAHEELVSFDGVISFDLNDQNLQKPLLFILENQVFLINIKLNAEYFILTIRSTVKPLPTQRSQFGVNFFKRQNPSKFNLVHMDYFVHNVSFESYFKISKEELTDEFGPEIEMCCQILVDSFVLETKESELERRYARLRNAEENLRELKHKIMSKEQKLSHQINTNKASMDIIKLMSYNLFKCSTCQKISPKAMYFCSKIHCCCEDCLTNICKICDIPRVFKRLKDVENFIVSCDWTGCDEILELRQYFHHKIECPRRQYKCPIEGCNEIVLSADNLIEHWHIEIPKLIRDDSLTFDSFTSEEIFWLLKHELYRGLIKFNQNTVEVLIEEVSVLPSDIKFKCEGYVEDSWHNLDSTDLCGKFHVNVANLLVVKKSDTESAEEKMSKIKISILS